MSPAEQNHPHRAALIWTSRLRNECACTQGMCRKILKALLTHCWYLLRYSVIAHENCHHRGEGQRRRALAAPVRAFQLLSLFYFLTQFIHQPDNFFNINEIMTCQNLKTFEDSHTQDKPFGSWWPGPDSSTSSHAPPLLCTAPGCLNSSSL